MSNLLSTYFDNVFDDEFFRPISTMPSRMLSTAPAANIHEYDDRYEISFTVPGIDTNQLKIEMVDNTITLSYKHEESTKDNAKGKNIRREYSHYSFSRSITLPNNVDTDSIKARSSKGILTITVEKLPETKPKTINIDSEE